MTRTISPNPIVAIARKTPRRRRIGKAKSAATAAAQSIASTMLAPSGQPYCMLAIVETYAAIPAKPACARASWPAWSETTSESASSALTPIWSTSRACCE